MHLVHYLELGYILIIFQLILGQKAGIVVLLLSTEYHWAFQRYESGTTWYSTYTDDTVMLTGTSNGGHLTGIFDVNIDPFFTLTDSAGSRN